MNQIYLRYDNNEMKNQVTNVSNWNSCLIPYRGLDALSKKAKSSTVDLPIESVSLSLQDLIGYFHPPDEHLEHEDKQNRLRALKNRQNLFQEEVSDLIFPLAFNFRTS